MVYLRLTDRKEAECVGRRSKTLGSRFIVNKGGTVEMVTIPRDTVKSLVLRSLGVAEVIDVTKTLLSPLAQGTTISNRAAEQLNLILNDKEIVMKSASAKEAKTKKFATTSATKKTATKAVAGKKPPKSAKTDSNGGGRLDEKTIKALVKENPCREGTFCHAQVEAMLKSKTVAEAQKKLDASGHNPNKRRIEIAWAVKNGYIAVA